MTTKRTRPASKPAETLAALKREVAALKHELGEHYRERHNVVLANNKLVRENANLRRIITELSNDRTAALGVVEIMATRIRRDRHADMDSGDPIFGQAGL